MKKKKTLAFVLCLGVYAALFAYSFHSGQKTEAGGMTDVSRLFPMKIKQTVKGKEEETLIETVKEANRKNIKISIAGTQHSMGGHTYYEDGIVLDMTSYNKILAFNKEKKSSGSRAERHGMTYRNTSIHTDLP